ncbi:DUF3488 and DUF4129 domain-containing transglutaminase family protein [Alienimonas sp. DA493]|uniref:transglutaminase TgpA family protein n=1 Tax=Alienimonas sp. DA493 TaxID=3373605 RepID=UPI003754863E
MSAPAAAIPSSAAAPAAPPARWRVWLLGAGQRTPVAPAAAAIGPVAVAAAAGMMLALGEGSLWPAALTPPFVLAAHVLVDRVRAFHLPGLIANLLGLAAAALAVTELTSGEIEARLLFGAHLLVYLTWIISLQRKTFKVCWSLVALAVLQVAVASVLTAGVQFGLGLVVFLALTLWALANLSARWPDADRLRASGRTPPRPRTASVVRAGRVGADSVGGSGRTVAAVGAVALAVGLAAFLLMPRMWLSRRPPMDPSRSAGISAAYTGFSGEVRLGALGEILESRELAFEVEVERPRKGLSLETNDVEAVFGAEEPLFRGRALDRYVNGRWSDSLGARTNWEPVPRQPPASATVTAVERYRLRPLGDEVLIHVGAAAAVVFPERLEDRAQRRSLDGLLLRPRSLSNSAEVEYVVFAAEPSPDRTEATRRQGRGRNVRPRRGTRDAPPPPAEVRRAERSGPQTRLRGPFREAYLQRPGDLPAVTAAAEAALAGADADDLNRLRTAERLTSFLRDSGRFGYSLDLSVQDPTIDAVEDFLANKRVGHCEYFATALALMLRDRGIPSRIVTGFKGGDLNGATRRFEVQQRHAHAWVEGYVDGRWTTFDPTPAAARQESVAASGPRFARLAAVVNGVEAVWAEYVVRMSLDRQRTAFGQPLANAWNRFRKAAEGWILGGSDEGGGPRFDGRAGAVAAAVLLALAGLGWAGRGLFARRWRVRRERRARESAVRFWRRFVRLAARRGVVQDRAETPSEFAARATAAWAEWLDGDLAGLPASAAADFYAVRFGAAALPADRVAQLAAALDRLEERSRTRE